MLQKCAILGLVLLLMGGALWGWLYHEAQLERQQAQSLAAVDTPGSQEYIEKYGRWYQLSPERQSQLALELDQERKSKTTAQLEREQQARLRADLDKLAAGQMYPGDIADFLYGPGWEEQVEQYKTHREQRQTVQNLTRICLSLGGGIFGGAAILGLVLLTIRGVRALRQRSCAPESEPKPEEAKLTDIDLLEAQPSEASEASAAPEQPRQRRRVLARPEALDDTSSEHSTEVEDFFVLPAAQPPEGHWSAPAGRIEGKEAGIAVLLSDEQSSSGGWSPQDQWSLNSPHGGPSKNLFPGQPSGQPSHEVSTVEKSLKEHAEDLQKQLAEFKEVAQHVQQATRERPEPLGDTLKELTQQVSAIREYAASQQNRVEKLQDGYDWGIIRTFCLRVIRCLDNLESRLEDLPQDNDAAKHLEETRDELLFALESSGIEQFRPDLHSEFHGQEKLAEALKEKQPAKKPEQVGKIARVIRPGYRYLVDDENYRVVRTAQVKLYG